MCKSNVLDTKQMFAKMSNLETFLKNAMYLVDFGMLAPRTFWKTKKETYTFDTDFFFVETGKDTRY